VLIGLGAVDRRLLDSVARMLGLVSCIGVRMPRRSSSCDLVELALAWRAWRRRST
jgi:hypothetical protein